MAIMEAVEGMMGKLQLTEVERQGIKIGNINQGERMARDPQAVGKLLADKPAQPEVIERTLGKIWCPVRGIECKDLGENHFLLTFHQASGKRRALEEGPWMLGRELMVIVDFDGTKSTEEMDFSLIPIWVRVARMPLGLMTKAYGEIIGNQIGNFMEVDGGEDGLAVGQFLRIKVKIDINLPLMRGIKLIVGEAEEEKEIWCPFTYEFLPDFCYTCGIIGHTDKSCERKLPPGAMQQYSRTMRVIPERRKGSDDGGSWRSSQKAVLPWRPSGGGGSGGSANRKSGSDSSSWRKSGSQEDAEKVTKGKTLEVISPAKIAAPGVLGDHTTVQKALFGDRFEDDKAEENSIEEMAKVVAAVTQHQEGSDVMEKNLVDVNSALLPMHVDRSKTKGDEAEKKKVTSQATKSRTFKRQPRSGGRHIALNEGGSDGGKKRKAEGAEAMEIDNSKKAKGDMAEEGEARVRDFMAGPADRSCESR